MPKLSNATIAVLKPLIQEFEGCKLRAYKCPAGIWTIGYGQTGQNINSGTVWTQQQADNALAESMQKYWDDALKWSPNLINASPSRQAAIIDFCYNCGVGNYHISSLLKSVNAENWEQAKVNIMKWTKAKDPKTKKLVELKGLVRRRQAEANLLTKEE